jgi:hypothetical protein
MVLSSWIIPICGRQPKGGTKAQPLLFYRWQGNEVIERVGYVEVLFSARKGYKPFTCEKRDHLLAT